MLAAYPVMTDADDGPRAVQLGEPLWHQPHRDMRAVHAGQPDDCLLQLPGLAHVQENGLAREAQGVQIVDGELFHQNLNFGGSLKPLRRGATMSNSSAVS